MTSSVIDGNEAAARPDRWGAVPRVIEMQSPQHGTPFQRYFRKHSYGQLAGVEGTVPHEPGTVVDPDGVAAEEV